MSRTSIDSSGQLSICLSFLLVSVGARAATIIVPRGSLEEVPAAAELEHVWVMHGGIFYYAVRKYIYHSRVGRDFNRTIQLTVDAMLAGVKAIGPAAGPQVRKP